MGDFVSDASPPSTVSLLLVPNCLSANTQGPPWWPYLAGAGVSPVGDPVLEVIGEHVPDGQLSVPVEQRCQRVRHVQRDRPLVLAHHYLELGSVDVSWRAKEKKEERVLALWRFGVLRFERWQGRANRPVGLVL